MADIKVRIEVNPNQETEFLGDIQNQVGTSGSVENISNVSIKSDSLGVYSNIPTIQNAITGINGLSLGQDLVFDENGYLDNQDLQGAVIEDEQNPDEFVWGVVSESGEYHVKLTFINAQNLKDIIVKGDDVVGQFPTQAIVDGQTTIYSDDNYWAINLQTESNTHTIEFTHWNRPNYNACLTLISVMLRYYEIDNRGGLKSIESLSQSTGQPKEIFYGVVPSSGSLEIVDVDGEIGEMVENGIMPNSNVSIEIIANGNQIQEHISSESEYQNAIGTKSLNIQLDDDLSLWDNINFKGYQLNVSSSLYSVLSEMLIDFYTQDEIDEMLDGNIFNQENRLITILEYTKSITIEYPYLPTSTLREAIDKVCAMTQLNVLKNKDNKIKFVSARPVRFNNQNIISIPKNKQLSILNRDIFIKNKYGSVNVSYMTTTFGNKSLNDVTYTYYEYENISIYISDYTKIIDDKTKNPDLTVIYDELPSHANISEPNDNPYYQNWYYYIGKFNVIYDLNDLTIMRNFDVTIESSVNMIFPTASSEETAIRESEKMISTITPVDYTYADDAIISEWIEYNSDKQAYQVKSGTPNFGFKVRKNQDGSLDVIYISLFRITSFLDIPLQEPEEYIRALYNALNINLLVPKISQSATTQQENADVSISETELQQDNTSIGDTHMYDFIQSNILTDYKNGIITGTISVPCLDYNDINSNKIKDWTKGEVIEVGDVVRIDNENGNSMYKYTNGKDMYFEVTGRTFRKNGIPLLDLELRETKPLFNSISFAEDSWGLINQIAQSGMANQYYSVGDEKTITLTTGEQVTLVIVGFNHDDLTSGVKAPITIGMKDCLNTPYRMNPTSNVTSWNESEMRTETLQTIFSQLPTDLQEIIKNVNKRTSIGRDGISISSDNLWLFSRVEIDNTTTNYYADEGMQYEYWRTIKNGEVATDRIKSNNWWLRSNYYNPPFNYGFDYYVYIYQNNGDFLAGLAYNSAGISFGFCI